MFVYNQIVMKCNKEKSRLTAGSKSSLTVNRRKSNVEAGLSGFYKSVCD